ncbi:MAG: hypothetical protein WD071_04235 [Pseudohongiella sp.]|uniref:hypothetical protein n=1 Tax=Pseudohongiella sp. TaxID=1979412 RepID=UPI0034A0383A
MATINNLLGILVLGVSLSAAAHGQGSDSPGVAAGGLSDEQLDQRFSRLDSNGDGVLSPEEFRQMRGMAPPRGERMGQMSPEQREQMRERMQNMTPEQREQMRERMREQMRQRGEQPDSAHDHDAQ